MPRLLVMADARSVHTERWCRYFEGSGFETALFSLEPCTITPPRQVYAGRRRTGLGAWDYYLAQKELKEAVRDFRPDIVNPHYIISYGWLARLCRLRPAIATAWGSDLLLLPQRSFFHRRRIRQALTWADYCTVDNDNLAEAAGAFIPEEKLVRVIMGIERRQFRIMFKSEFSQAGPLRLVAPRGLQQVYDPATIIEAAALVSPEVDFRIDLFGAEKAAVRMEAEIRKRSLERRIHLVPPVPHEEFVANLKLYDIYLSASLSDSTSVALLEAMAAGLFPVVSDITGNRPWVNHETNGLLFTPGSPASLAEAIAEAASRRSSFGQVASMNRDRVEREAIWEDNMDRLRDLMLTLVP